MIDIDGSVLEGGGQIIRTAVAMSCLTRKSCRIDNIRKGRPSPGLRAQHLVGIRSAAELLSAELMGDDVGSLSVTFIPKKPNSQNMKIDVGTAGAVTLVLQTLVPICLQLPKPVTLEISGGTHVAWSPPFDYFQRVFCSMLERMGATIESEILSYGFYPRGGGRVRIKVMPYEELVPLDLTERVGEPEIHAVSIASDFLKKNRVAERQLEGMEKTLSSDSREIRYVRSASPGSCAYTEARFGNSVMAASSLGERGKPAEMVGREAAKELERVLQTKAVVDTYLADQLIPYMALAEGKSRILAPEFSRHTETNIWVMDKFGYIEFTTKKTDGGVLIEYYL